MKKTTTYEYMSFANDETEIFSFRVFYETKNTFNAIKLDVFYQKMRKLLINYLFPCAKAKYVQHYLISNLMEYM